MRAQSPVRNSSPTDEATPGMRGWTKSGEVWFVDHSVPDSAKSVSEHWAETKFAEEWFVYCNLCCRNAGLGATLFH